MRQFINLLIVAFAFVAVSFWEQLNLTSLTVPALGFLVFLYISSSAHSRLMSTDTNTRGKDILQSMLLLMTVLLLVTSTGGRTSPFYFLLYFLPFAISFLLTPISAFTVAIGIVFLLLPELPQQEMVRGLIQIGSLMLISPLAYFLSSEYQERQRLEKTVSTTAEHIAKDVGEIIKDKTESLTKTESKALLDILKQVETLEGKEDQNIQKTEK